MDLSEFGTSDSQCAERHACVRDEKKTSTKDIQVFVWMIHDDDVVVYSRDPTVYSGNNVNDNYHRRLSKSSN